jgi:hypothetical protein
MKNKKRRDGTTIAKSSLSQRMATVSVNTRGRADGVENERNPSLGTTKRGGDPRTSMWRRGATALLLSCGLRLLVFEAEVARESRTES